MRVRKKHASGRHTLKYHRFGRPWLRQAELYFGKRELLVRMIITSALECLLTIEETHSGSRDF